MFQLTYFRRKIHFFCYKKKIIESSKKNIVNQGAEILPKT